MATKRNTNTTSTITNLVILRDLPILGIGGSDATVYQGTASIQNVGDNVQVAVKVFPPETYLEFKSDFSDFNEKFEMATGDGNERLRIVNSAFDIAFTHHTWKVRISSMISTFSQYI